MKSFSSRFWSHVLRIEDGCWVWQGCRDESGYGQFYKNARQRSAKVHRISWELTFGPIPEGMMVCHHCDNPPCVRPDHLFLGTANDNNQDKIRKGRARGGRLVGVANGQSKLSEAQVLSVFDRLANGESQQAIAEDLGISSGALNVIVKGKKWVHLVTPAMAAAAHEATKKNQSRRNARLSEEMQGEKHPQAKLNESQVMTIHKRRSNGETQGQIAKSLNVSRATVGDVLRGKTWGHLHPKNEGQVSA